MLAWLVAAQGALIALGCVVSAGLITVSKDSGYADPNQRFAVAGMFVVFAVVWGGGLLLASRAVLAGRRWSFSVILFTQMMWGAVCLASIQSSAGAVLAVQVILLAFAISILALLFQPEVRHLLGRGPAPGR
jgi:presenilin-like A22 family membrane protease